MNPPGWGKAIEENLPAHYIDCDRFQIYDHGLRQGKCDCTADEDIKHLIAWATSHTIAWEPSQQPAHNEAVS